MRAEPLRFDRYVLDLERGALLLEGSEIPLRPKTFAVLQHLTQHAGRLVRKDELFSAAWPTVTVTEDTLVQSIGELRRALGDDGPRLIKTVPRRGYRLEAEVVHGFPPIGVVPMPEAPASAGVHPYGSPPVGIIRKCLNSFARSARARPAYSIAVLGLVMLACAGALLSRETRFAAFPRVETQAPPTSASTRSIAVLPFLNRSSDSSRDHLADGLTQDVINALGRFPELKVMSWNAVLPYKAKPTSTQEIGRALAVRYQVEGGVLLTDDYARVTAQLVDSDGRVLWSMTFNEPLSDLLLLQGKITTEIAGALAIRVAASEQGRLLTKPTASLEAYDYVLRAWPALARPTRAGIVEARGFLRRAIEIDPNYAAAYAGLAETYFTATSMGWAEFPVETLARAQDLAIKALSLDDRQVRARVVLGRIHILYQRYDRANAEMARAVGINPSDAKGLAGRGNVLMWMGHTDPAIEALELAKRIDPELNAMDRFALSLAYYLKGRYGDAIAEAELNLGRTDGANFSRVVLTASYAQQDRRPDAMRLVSEIQRLDPTFDVQEFGTKFLNASNLEHLREGLRKAGF